MRFARRVILAVLRRKRFGHTGWLRTTVYTYNKSEIARQTNYEKSAAGRVDDACEKEVASVSHETSSPIPGNPSHAVSLNALTLRRFRRRARSPIVPKPPSMVSHTFEQPS